MTKMRIGVVTLLAGLLAPVLAACGSNPTAHLPSLTGDEGPSHKGDISPRRVAQPLPNGNLRPGSRRRTTTPLPKVTMTPLPQPDETFATPKMPEPPAKSDPELSRITYELKRVVWGAAGVVDPKTTKAKCSKGENDIIQVGSYQFSCDVTLWGSSTRFNVRAKVNRSDVAWSWSAARLPVSEDKAVYEATRQSFKPAKVTCDVIKLDLVEVGTREGVTCWVTDVFNKQQTYHGELLPDGALAFTTDS